MERGEAPLEIVYATDAKQKGPGSGCVPQGHISTHSIPCRNSGRQRNSRIQNVPRLFENQRCPTHNGRLRIQRSIMDFLALTAAEKEALSLSLWISGWALAGSLPLGVLCAWGLARRNFPGKILMDGLIHLPLVLPPVVTGYVLLVVFGRKGLLGEPLYKYLGVNFSFNWKGAVLASAIVAFPLLVRAVRLSIENVDQGLEAAARTPGAHPLRVFFTITLPLAIPGVLTGMILSFARSLSEFGATITFVSNIPGETRTLPLALYTLTQMPDGEAAAFRLCVISVALALAAIMTSELLSRRMSARLEG